MNTRPTPRLNPRPQRGSVLVVSLMILVLLTLIGITAMGNTTLEEKMAGNSRDRQLAFQAAESALLANEDWLEPLTVDPIDASAGEGCSSPPCNVLEADGTVIASKSASWWPINAREYGTARELDIAGVAHDPYFVIEEQGFVPDSLEPNSPGRTMYRVTARGVGSTSQAEVILEETYAKRYD